MNDFEFEMWLLESDRSRHTAIIRDLKREFREAREQEQDETKRLVKGDQGVKR
jgi:hypothetical protein